MKHGQDRLPGWLATFVLATGLVASSVAAAGDHVFNATFDAAAEGPYTDAEAARFLTQATFGPTRAEIDRLRGIGYHAWLGEQYALAPSLHRPYMESIEAAGEDIYQHIRREAWWTFAISAPDQLRQRVAFALSELFVVSEQGGGLEGLPIPLAHYYDLLVNGAFGNYRDLLEQVTLSPVMGHYLSMFKNRKADPEQNIRPDENYAREIMQLFSIGLVRLNPDGTPLLVADETVPTYDQDTISGFAKVFTGWNYPDCDDDPPDGEIQPWEWQWCASGPVPWPEPGWDDYEMVPMEAYEAYHASAADKQLLEYPGVTLTGGVLPGGGTARSDLDAALDNIFRHPNVAPFIATHLIKRLVTSNPSPAYVGRVAAVFANNGVGVRGDLGATVNAVLFDPEARTLPSLASNAGKLREPLLRQTHLWRAMNAHAADDRYREWWNDDYGQLPLGSPTVFNFFLPDYMPPGELTELGLRAPEFQITTDTTIATTAAQLGVRLYWNWDGMDGQEPDDVVVDLSAGVALADDPVRLVDHYDLVFMNRTMSDFMFDTLVEHVEGITHWDGTIDDEARRERVMDTVWLIQSSAEYAVER
jgi:uncharacterized protein (DUF1800 family)